MPYKCKGFNVHLWSYYDIKLKMEEKCRPSFSHRLQLALAGQVFKAVSIVQRPAICWTLCWTPCREERSWGLLPWREVYNLGGERDGRGTDIYKRYVTLIKIIYDVLKQTCGKTVEKGGDANLAWRWNLKGALKEKNFQVQFSVFPLLLRDNSWIPPPASTSLITWALYQLFQKEERPKDGQAALQ